MRNIFKIMGVILITLAFLINMPTFWQAQANKPLVYTVEIEDMVTRGTYQHVHRTINLAKQYEAEAVIIKINTPGGLVNSTLDILKVISGSDIPIITYVAPKSGIAASAGSFILISGDIAAMTPGTTCGAAMPVTMSTPGDSPQAADEKTINFLAAHMKTVAEDKGRAGEVAKSFVTENLSLNAEEALEQGIIEYLAPNLENLLQQVDGLEIIVNDKPIILNTANANITNVEKIVDEKLTNTISNPTIAIILLMLGVYGLIIGFNSPGFLFPEVLGAICLILGLYGIGSFEVNITAGLLLILGVGLLVAEAFTPTYGVLAAGGVISIVLGILFMPIEPMMPIGWFTGFKVMAIGVGAVGAVLILVILTGIWRLRKINPMHGKTEFIEQKAETITELNPTGQVRLKGEIWQAKAEDNLMIPAGTKVEIVARENLWLIVKKDEKEV